jgi:hypothetical protein
MTMANIHQCERNTKTKRPCRSGKSNQSQQDAPQEQGDDLLSIDSWVAALEFCKRLPERPTEAQLRTVAQMAQSQEHWIAREEAVDVLGRCQYDPSVLGQVASEDDHASVRQAAQAWLVDYAGQLLKYNLKHRQGPHSDNRFGRTWDELGSEVTAVVAAIDEDGDNASLPRIGLSAMQMTNLRLERKSPPLNAQTLAAVIAGNALGLDDGQDFGDVIVIHGDREQPAHVYNAFGVRAIGGPGIRLSRPLAASLGIKRGDTVVLRPALGRKQGGPTTN